MFDVWWWMGGSQVGAWHKVPASAHSEAVAIAESVSASGRPAFVVPWGVTMPQRAPDGWDWDMLRWKLSVRDDMLARRAVGAVL